MQRQQEKDCFECVKLLAKKNNDTLLLSFFDKTEANTDSNSFPDFLFDGGFIEHFQVSAAKENKKGSDHNIKVNNFESSSEMEFEQDKNEFLRSDPCEYLQTNTFDVSVKVQRMPSPRYSYSDFVYSFKRNFEKHIKSLRKYMGEKAVGIFLIELVGANITIMQGDRFVGFYRIKFDKELLKFIERYTEFLKLIIFKIADEYEILELSEIPKLLDNIPQGYSFDVGRFINQNIILFVDK